MLIFIPYYPKLECRHLDRGVIIISVSKDLEKNRLALQNALGNSPDIIFRDIKIGRFGVQALIIYINGLVEEHIINDSILRPFSFEARLTEVDKTKKLTMDIIKEDILSVSDIKEESLFPEILNNIVSGNAAIFIQGIDTSLIVAAKSARAMRAVGTSIVEGVLKGPQEGFVETLRTNTALIRRKIQSPKLRFEEIIIGSITQTTVCIAYLDGLADKELINEIRERLNRIKIDGILESNYIEELIGDVPYSPFPTLQTTERPDIVAGSLLEGRAAIITDGTPFAIVVPVTFPIFLQASEDYYKSFVFSTAVRLMRYVAFLMALFVPSFYIALISYHSEMLPTALALSISASRQGVPFPSFVEALIMEISFELLREASIRLPHTIAQSISIVGTLVIGEAAVRAGIVSPVMVIIVSITAMASYNIPRYTMTLSVRLLRFPMMFLAATLGLFGVMMGGFIIFVHLASLRSFGIPYLAPIAPFNWRDQKDTFVRASMESMITRPLDTGHQDPIRAKPRPKSRNPLKGSGR